jgi:hypothetical protein
MSAKKFLVIMLAIGLIKVCHPASQPIIINSFHLPHSQPSQVNIYPCFTYSNPTYGNSAYLAQALQVGVGVQMIF